MTILDELLYTKEHEWVKIEGNIATIGITDFAQSELGDIVFIEIESVGKQLTEGEIFGTVEAVKTVSDLFMPLTGKVLEMNTSLNDNPELVNTDAYNEGWMIKIEISNDEETSSLLDASAYRKLIGI
ncbi:MAG: glycine cleavage system protein GcvH [Bacteroidota bacterium]